MSYGLRDSDIQTIQKVGKQWPEIEEILLFGSRAKGNFKPGSDVDLAVRGKNIGYDTVLHFEQFLNEETRLPYFFDVLHVESLKEPDLLEHINRVGVAL